MDDLVKLAKESEPRPGSSVLSTVGRGVGKEGGAGQ